jgi:hypothetical protein
MKSPRAQIWFGAISQRNVQLKLLTAAGRKKSQIKPFSLTLSARMQIERANNFFFDDLMRNTNFYSLAVLIAAHELATEVQVELLWPRYASCRPQMQG